MGFFRVQNSVLTSVAEIVLTVSYLSCSAKLWFEKSLLVKSLNELEFLHKRSHGLGGGHGQASEDYEA